MECLERRIHKVQLEHAIPSLLCPGFEEIITKYIRAGEYYLRMEGQGDIGCHVQVSERHSAPN